MHLEGVIKGGAGGGKKYAKMLIAQLSSDVIFYNTKISTHNSTTWIFKFLIVINHLIIVAMIALKYLDLLQGVKFLFSNLSIMTYIKTRDWLSIDCHLSSCPVPNFVTSYKVKQINFQALKYRFLKIFGVYKVLTETLFEIDDRSWNM